jgi:hypothetical protein
MRRPAEGAAEAQASLARARAASLKLPPSLCTCTKPAPTLQLRAATLTASLQGPPSGYLLQPRARDGSLEESPRHRQAWLALALRHTSCRRRCATAQPAQTLLLRAAMLTASSQSLPAVVWPRPALKAALRGGAGCLKPPPSDTPGKRDPPRLPSQPRQRMRYNAAVTARAAAHLTPLQLAASELAPRCFGGSSRPAPAHPAQHAASGQHFARACLLTTSLTLTQALRTST